MGNDPHATDEDDADAAGPLGNDGELRRFTDFDCPSCTANNPYDDAFGDGDEVRCFYCGLEFLVRVRAGGRLDLREL